MIGQRGDAQSRSAESQNLTADQRLCHSSKKKGDVFSRLLWVFRFGGCLQVEQLRSSGAKSGLLHLLACSVRCGMDALHFELEVVWIAGVLQGGFIADQALRVQIVEGLVERLHTVLGGAGANGLMQQARLFRGHDAFADKRGRDQDLSGWDAACSVSALNKSLADDGPQCGAKLHTHLLLLRWRKYSDDTVDGFNCIQCMQC